MAELDLDALGQAAREAGGGCWFSTCWTVGSRGFEVVDLKSRDRICSDATKRCAEFIAAANPATILEILDRLEAAEKDVTIKEEVIGSLAAAVKRLDAQCDAAEKAVTEAYQRGYATGQEEVAAELEFAKREIANLHDDISEWMDKCDALRAKIAEMERQEPVAEWLPLDSGEDTRRD